jgi:hypothetical protein
MRRPNAIIRVSDEEIQTLQDWTRRGKSEHRLVERAGIILLAGEGRSNEQIARALKTRTARVSKWRQRFGARRLVLRFQIPQAPPRTHPLTRCGTNSVFVF